MPATAARRRAADAGSTRQRILDVALDLFIEQGFDKTPLRQIAEKLGFSKAALYYHFASKDDILMALHLRLHELGKESLAALGDRPSGAEAWVADVRHLHLADDGQPQGVRPPRAQPGRLREPASPGAPRRAHRPRGADP